MLTLQIPGPNDSNSPNGIYNLWNAASVILGFQLAAFAWRMTRERKVAAQEQGTKEKRGTEDEELTWFPFADKLNLSSMLVNIVGVFLAPIFGLTWIHPAGALAVSLILLAAYPFASAGHYSLFFKNWEQHKFFPRQERVVVAVAVLLVIATALYFRHPRVALGIFLGSVLVTIILARKGQPNMNPQEPQQSPGPPQPDPGARYDEDKTIRLLMMEEATLQTYRSIYLTLEAVAMAVVAIIFTQHIQLIQLIVIGLVAAIGCVVATFAYRRCWGKLQHVRHWENQLDDAERQSQLDKGEQRSNSRSMQFSEFCEKFYKERDSQGHWKKPSNIDKRLRAIFLLAWVIILAFAFYVQPK